MKKILLFSAALIALLGCVEDKMFEGPSSIDKVAFTPEAPGCDIGHAQLQRE